MVAHAQVKQKFSLARGIALQERCSFWPERTEKSREKGGAIFFVVGQMSGSHKGRKR
jgi:hypothetical protein